MSKRRKKIRYRTKNYKAVKVVRKEYEAKNNNCVKGWKNYITQSVKSINWIKEFIVALMTTIMVVVLSTTILWVIFKASPGEYKGNKLSEYLAKKIVAELNISNKNECLHIDRVIEHGENTIALCGNYKMYIDEDYSGCFVCVFERKQKNFWNALVGTNADFEMVSSVRSNAGINYDRMLACEDSFFDDIDDDGHDELLFFYRCNYADRIMRFPIVLQRNNGVWDAIASDFSELLDEENNKLGLPKFINLQKLDFVLNNINGRREFVIFGQSRDGVIRIVDNPIWGGRDWLYYVTASDIDRIHTEKTIMIMERVSDHGFSREDNWNGGKVAVYDTWGVTEDTYDEKWGIITQDGMMFYGEDG